MSDNTLSKPWPMQDGTLFGESDLYRFIDDIMSSGIVGSGDFAVSQNGSGDLSVNVAGGSAYVAITSPYGGKRRIFKSAASNSGTPGAANSPGWESTFSSPNATNPRVDRVVLKVYDNLVDGSTKYQASLAVVAGTPTSGATLTNLTGAAAIPANAILLANVLVAANATQILTANIDTTVRSLATSASGAANAPQGVPSGAVIDWPYASASVPSGYVLPYGQPVSRTGTYANLNALASAAGYPHGAGDGSTTFLLPDYRGRTGIGMDNMGGSAAGRLGTVIAGTTLGAAAGVETYTLSITEMPSHSHTPNESPHAHTYGSNAGEVGNTGNPYPGGNSSGPTSSNSTGITLQNTGGGGAHGNLQPSLIVNKIIKL